MFNSVRFNQIPATAALGAALLGMVVIPQLRASEIDKKVVMTFSAPVEIPGHVLPAGTYVFKRLPESPNVIMVYDRNERKLYGTTLTIPKVEATNTADVPDKVTVNLAERPANNPPAIDSWSYPGDNTGYEFIYPNGEAAH
jgi:hypothetical protein